MQPKPFTGTVFPAKTFSSVAAEVKDMAAGRPTADELTYARHLDELRNRVDVGSGPDKVIPFNGTGAIVRIAHGLVTAAGAGIVPRFVRLASFKSLTDFAATADETNVNVTANSESSGTIEVYI